MLVDNKNFKHLKVHTQYSICEGAIKIDELADYCKINKIKSIGLADILCTINKVVNFFHSI